LALHETIHQAPSTFEPYFKYSNEEQLSSKERATRVFLEYLFDKTAIDGLVLPHNVTTTTTSLAACRLPSRVLLNELFTAAMTRGFVTSAILKATAELFRDLAAQSVVCYSDLSGQIIDVLQPHSYETILLESQEGISLVAVFVTEFLATDNPASAPIQAFLFSPHLEALRLHLRLNISDITHH
jgi:hypothetical protein